MPGRCPKRFAALFMGCGVNPDHWWAKGAGRDDGAGPVPRAAGAAARPRSTSSTACSTSTPPASASTPARPATSSRARRLQKGAELKGGISVDQVLAKHLGEETVQPSLVLGCEQPITGYHETNFSMAYSSHISWQSATSPVPMEVYPSLAFDSLFDNRGSQRNQSILDRVRERGRRPEPAGQRRRPGQARRVPDQRPRGREAGRADAGREGGRPTTAPATAAGPRSTMPRPDNGLPEDIREHMRLMCDIVALGFQTDKTRVATLLLCRDISGLFYPFLDVRAAHHARLARRPVRRLRAGHALLRRASSPTSPSRLDAMPEGDGTVLDNSCLLFTNSCGRAPSTTRARSRSSWPAAWAGRSRPAACSTTATRATTTASSAACTCRSWTAWASS